MLRGTKVTTVFFRMILMITIFLSCLMSAIFMLVQYKTFQEAVRSFREEYESNHKDVLVNQVKEAVESITYWRSQERSQLQEHLQQRINIAYALVKQMFADYQGLEDEEVLQQQILKLLASIRFGQGTESYFVVDTQGVLRMHPLMPEQVGRFVLDMSDQKGRKIFHEMLDIASAQPEGGSVEFSWTEPDDNQPSLKLTYVKLFEPLGWMIGTSGSLEEIEQHIRTKVLERLKRVRFGREGYLQIFLPDGTVLLDPSDFFLPGHSALETVKAPDDSFIRDILQRGIF